MSTTNTNTTAIGTLGSLQQNLVKLDNKYMTKINTNANSINMLDSKLNTLSSAALVRNIVPELPDVSDIFADENYKYNVIYMVPDNTQSESDAYNEYILVPARKLLETATGKPQSVVAAGIDFIATHTSIEKQSYYIVSADYLVGGDSQHVVVLNSTSTTSNYNDIAITDSTLLPFFNISSVLDAVAGNPNYKVDLAVNLDGETSMELYGPNFELIGNTRVDLTSKMDKFGEVSEVTYKNKSVTNITSDKPIMIGEGSGLVFVDSNNGVSEMCGYGGVTLSTFASKVELRSSEVFLESDFNNGLLSIRGVASPGGDYYAANKKYVDDTVANSINEIRSTALKRSVVDNLPDKSSADSQTIYMVKNSENNSESNFDEYLLTTYASMRTDLNITLDPAHTDILSMRDNRININHIMPDPVSNDLLYVYLRDDQDNYATITLSNYSDEIKQLFRDINNIWTVKGSDGIFFRIESFRNEGEDLHWVVELNTYEVDTNFELIGSSKCDLSSKMDKWGTVTYYNDGSGTNIASDTKTLMISAIENYPAHLYFDYDEGLAELHGISSAVLSGGVENQLKIGYTNASFASKSGVDMIVTGIADPSNSNDAVNKGYVDFEMHKLRNTLINRQIVSELPDETYASTNTIYMIRKTDSDDSDIYDEYMYTYRKNYKSDWSMTLLDGDASNFNGLDLDFNRDTKFNVDVSTNPSNNKHHVFKFYDSTDIQYYISYIEDETVFLDTNVSRILDELRLAILHGESLGTWFNINRYTTPQLEGEYRVTITAFTESYDYELIGSSSCDLSGYVTTETYNNKVTNLENRITELESVITEFSEKMSELSNDTASVN